MVSSGGYRLLGFTGASFLTSLAVVVANHPVVQEFITTYVPLLNRLSPTVLGNGGLALALLTALPVVLASLFPLFKPRPRRVLDTVFLTQKRVVVAGFALATIGYFDYTYRLPRSTLVVGIGVLLVALPLFFVLVRSSPSGNDRTVLIGNDADRMREVVRAYDGSIYGYVAPHNVYLEVSENVSTDGGVVVREERTGLGDLDYIGTLARLDDVLVDYNVSTALLAFRSSDRGEFFGILDTCYRHGVDAKVHRNHTESVLTSDSGHSDLMDIDLEPLDPQDYLVKRGFDVVFAVVGLLVFSIPMLLISLIIKLEDGGDVLYAQTRTAEFGGTFHVYKFRTMIPEGDSPDPIEDEANDRITRVGRFLRKTHLDELPQLWSILRGDMSVVGPRAVWTEEETILEERAEMWRRRWFIKPGLTGLAQINEASSTNPEEKLRYDLQYIRDQSFWYDIEIVIRQVWKVCMDLLDIFRWKSTD